METTRMQRWWQFTLRDALWLIVAVALCLGWWADHSRLIGQLKLSEFSELHYIQRSNINYTVGGDVIYVDGVRYRIVRD